MIFLPRGIPVRQKVNPARINLPEAMEKLRKGDFTGYLRFDATQGSGVILFQGGQLISAVFAGTDGEKCLIAYDAIAKVFEISILGNAVLNIYRLSPDLVLCFHALLHGRYLQKGEDLNHFDVGSLLENIKNEGLTACLRVYAEDKTALIFYDQGYALGFCFDGRLEMEASADIERSVALLPGARLDVLEIRSADEIVLADLMGSADLGPIWQRTRKLLMEERRKREETAIRSQEQDQSSRRQHTLAVFKTIAANHIGKFGVSQVEKAFAAVSAEMTSADLEKFYLDLQHLARLVAGQTKISTMIAEMKKQHEHDR
ncbi:hypothetical protein SAMN05660420_02371 [Desulfuromusa kysingii]|uniref:DUF4388 domain-containing protein n=1 Tax=Desulfuromusa kysingii TaxID=37625 RepID=A0A1H4C0K4_9BACT|nr:hypothetical protein [Desulfuromusa kysingii]SEA53906.1 hypothetical protein SAMN05660420_02371 [Desulfuromusa kysingii]